MTIIQAEPGEPLMHRSIVAVLLLLCALPLLAQAPATTPQTPPVKTPVGGFAILELRGGTASRTFANVTTPDVAIPLTFVEQQGKATTITIEATQFVDAAGNVVDPRLEPAGAAGPCEQARLKLELASKTQPGIGKRGICLDLGPRETKVIRIEASLPLAGAYETTISVRARVGKTPLDPVFHTIGITRVVAAPPVTVAPIAVHQVTTGWSGAGTEETVETTIHSTGGEVTLNAPMLLAATVKPKTDSLAGTRSALDFTADAPAIHVTPDSPGKLTGKLTHLSEAGRHDATLRFAQRGYTPLDIPVTVYVRQSAAVAFLFILAGVLVSFLVHAWSSSIRPRLIAQERGAELRSALRAAKAKAEGDAEALALVAGIERALEAAIERARRRRLALTTELDLYEAIVPAAGVWIDLHRQLASVRPVSVRDKLLPTLTTAKSVFITDPPDSAKVQESIEAMRKLPDTVRDEVKAALTAEVDTFDAKLAADPRPSVITIRAVLQRVRNAIRDKQIEQAVSLYAEARLRHVAVLVEDLRRRVAASAEQPIGVKLADWEQLKRDTNTALDAVAHEGDPDRSMILLGEAARDYLLRLAGALRLAAAAKLLAAAAEKVEKALEPIEARLKEDDLNGAWTSLDNGQKVFAAELKSAGAASMGLESILSAAAGVPAAPFELTQLFGLPPSWASLGDPGTAERARTLLNLFDVVVSIIVLVAATAVGLQILWIGNPTWGGPASYAVAFFWGFAVDQFTHAGLSGLAKKAS
jgi:hypothetical protein